MGGLFYLSLPPPNPTPEGRSDTRTNRIYLKAHRVRSFLKSTRLFTTTQSQKYIMICALTLRVTQARLKPIGFNRYGRYYNDNNTCSVHLYMHNIIPIIADNIRCQWCNAYIPLHEYKYKLYALQYLFCGSMRERTSC